MANGSIPLPPPPPSSTGWAPSAKGFWARRSAKGKAGILSVAAITVVVLANGGSNSPDATPTAAETTTQSPPALSTPIPSVTPDPTASPDPVAAPLTSPEPTPTPKPTPRIFVVTASKYVTDTRIALPGKTGTYSWTNVNFGPDKTLLRWTVDAGRKACQIRWTVDPDSGDSLAKTVKVAAGDQVKGSKKFTTSSIDTAAVTVKSTCPKFLLTMVEAPVTRTATSSHCDPNYTGACVPIVSYDLDCADIGQSVQVIGNDPHGFDADGDGLGCESYP